MNNARKPEWGRYQLPDGTAVIATPWAAGDHHGVRLDDVITGEPLYTFDQADGRNYRYQYTAHDDCYQAIPTDLQPVDLVLVDTSE